MLDIGWSELLVIGVVALIVVGPKDLPIMFRRMGQFTGRARAMAREFTSAMNAAADEAGVREMSSDLKKIANPRQMGLDALKGATDDLTKWDDTDGGAKKGKPPERKGPSRSELSPDRKDASDKIREASAKKASERLAREAEDAEAKPAATDDKTA